MPRSVGGWKWHRRRQAWVPIVAAGHVQCWRCRKYIGPGDLWDLGHRIDVSAGGTDDDTAPEHRACNRAAGARVTHARMRAAGFSDTGVQPPPRAAPILPPAGPERRGSVWERDW